jgi:uncharacterized protein YraI
MVCRIIPELNVRKPDAGHLYEEEYKLRKLKMASLLTVMMASFFIFSSHAQAVQYYTVSTSSGAPVNMRSGPGTSWGIVTTIPSGTRSTATKPVQL